MKTVCCVCQKMKYRKTWVKRVIKNNSLLSHGYCPDCYRKLMDIIKARIVAQERALQIQ